MITNEIDKFRKEFFDKIIKEEKEKAAAIMLAQKNCFHNYTIMGLINQNGYQYRTCSKCNHSALKSIRVWEGTKECVIS